MAYCGLMCGGCPARLATQADDQEALERVAVEWREMLNMPDLAIDSLWCDGCTNDGRLAGYCAMCDIRACNLERGFASCAECADYGCEKLDSIFPAGSDARLTLDGLRQA